MTGGINYSKAVTNGMPTSRGRKPNQAPRKKSKTKHQSEKELVVVPRVTGQQHNAKTAPPASKTIPSYATPRSTSSPHLHWPEVSALQHQTSPLTYHVQPTPASRTTVANKMPMCSPQDQTFPSLYQVVQPYTPASRTITVANHQVSNFGNPGFPSPSPGNFWISLLCYCPQITSVCFGCGGSLKPGGSIAAPPADLVVVSY